MMNMIMNRSLDYCRFLNSVPLKPTMEHADILQLCTKAANVMSFFATNSLNIFIWNNNDSDKPEVVTDVSWLNDNILCLLSNATKYTRDYTVQITIKARKSYVLFEFEDSGPGFDNKDAEPFFNPSPGSNVLFNNLH